MVQYVRVSLFFLLPEPGSEPGSSGRTTTTATPRSSIILTSISPSSEYPSSSGLRSLEQTFPEDLLQFGLEVEVGLSSLDGYEELRPLQGPFSGQQLDDQLGARVVGQPDVLWEEISNVAPRVLTYGVDGAQSYPGHIPTPTNLILTSCNNEATLGSKPTQEAV